MSSAITAQEAVNGQSRTGALTSIPILILNVHQNCNCRCIMCDIWKRPSGKELAIQQLQRYQDDIKSLRVQQVVLTGGEPLLHSRFRELCQTIRECGVRITLLSTGLLLRKRAQAIADGVDEVIVSLDGPEEVHNQIRRVSSAYRLIKEGIAYVRQLRPDMPFHVRSTIQSANFERLRQTVAAAKAIGGTSISFLAVDTTSSAFNRELIWPEERRQTIGLTSVQVKGLEREVEFLVWDNAIDFESGYIAESPEKLRRLVQVFWSRLGAGPPSSPMCNAPWVSAVVEVDGSLRPCFFHPVVSETRTQSIAQAINSPEAIRFRQTLDVSKNRICQGCVCSLNYSPKNTSNAGAR
jgi:MoaA/NifB/PqqE/SkfB family radical SAM enzyme